MGRISQDVDWYLERLEGVEGGNGQWSAWCPCHDDLGTSVKGLSLTQQGHRLLGKCHSPHCGATLRQVFDVLDEDPEEPVVAHVTRVNGNGTRPTGGMHWWIEKTGVPEDVWNAMGCYEHGQGVAFHFGEEYPIKVRTHPKEIHWEPKGANTPPLWPIPDDELPEKISIWEGESDAGTASAAGLPKPFAITGGAKTPLPPGWASSLASRGVSAVLVGGDADESGMAFRSRLAREATAAGLAVEVVRLETILDPFSGLNDLNDVWRACDTREQFEELIERATQEVARSIPFFSVSEMEEEAEREINWLIPELIAPGDKIMLAAPQKSLKSWITLELTRSLVTQSAFLNRAEWVPERAVRVGLVQEEGSRGLWARRIQMLGITGNENAIFAHKTGFKFTEGHFTDEIISAIRDQALDFLILDPLQRMMPGLDSNSDTDTGIVWDEVFRIQQAHPHCVVMIVHHANKHDRLSWDSIRGSSRHAGEVDVGIFLERHPLEDQTLRLWLDGRDIPQYLGANESFEVKYKLDRDTRTAEFDASEISVSTPTRQLVGKSNRDLVATSVASGHGTRKEIIEDTNLSEATVREHLKTLVDSGTIEVTVQGTTNTYTMREQ